MVLVVVLDQMLLTTLILLDLYSSIMQMHNHMDLMEVEVILLVQTHMVLEVVVLSVLEVILDKLMATLLVERKEAAVMVAKDCY